MLEGKWQIILCSGTMVNKRTLIEGLRFDFRNAENMDLMKNFRIYKGCTYELGQKTSIVGQSQIHDSAANLYMILLLTGNQWKY